MGYSPPGGVVFYSSFSFVRPGLDFCDPMGIRFALRHPETKDSGFLGDNSGYRCRLFYDSTRENAFICCRSRQTT